MWEARLESQLEGDVGAWGQCHTACKALACHHHEAGACPEPCLQEGREEKPSSKAEARGREATSPNSWSRDTCQEGIWLPW